MSIKVCYLVLSYNQSEYISDALESIYNQSYKDFYVYLSDDSSVDDTYNIMMSYAKRYEGSVKTILNKNPVNLGVVAHFNRVIKSLDADIVIYNAGDDISRIDRAEKLLSFFTEGISYVESGYKDFSGDKPCYRSVFDGKNNNNLISASDVFSGRTQKFCSGTRAFRLSALKKFPDLSEALASEDSANAVRLLMSGNGFFIDEDLLFKRVHKNNQTGVENLKKMDFALYGNQYYNDANFAFSIGLIDGVFRDSILSWAKKTIIRRQLRQEFEHKRPSLSTFIFKLLPSRFLKIKDKFYAMRALVFGVQRGLS